MQDFAAQPADFYFFHEAISVGEGLLQAEDVVIDALDVQNGSFETRVLTVDNCWTTTLLPEA